MKIRTGGTQIPAPWCQPLFHALTLDTMPASKKSPKAKSPAEKPPVDIKANPYADAPVNKALTPEQKIDLFRLMVRIRRFEQISLKYYQEKKMGGFLHLYIGQESVAVGTISLCGANDHVITAYRDHGHALAVGMNMNECMAELYGKITGCSKGKGGSMHFFAPDKNYWGGHGIVGGQTPLGTGLAFGLKYKGLKGCCLAYLGDGAINQGAFHESLNLAGLFDLPVIFVIENNGYSMGTSQIRSSVHPPEGLAARAAAYDIDWDICEDGENLYAVRAHDARALERAHDDGIGRIARGRKIAALVIDIAVIEIGKGAEHLDPKPREIVKRRPQRLAAKRQNLDRHEPT